MNTELTKSTRRRYMPGHLPQFGYATRTRADTTTPHRMKTFWCMLHLLSFGGQMTGCFNIPLCIFITQICPTTYLAFAPVCTECVLEVVSLATVRKCTELNQWRRLNLYFMSYNNINEYEFCMPSATSSITCMYSLTFAHPILFKFHSNCKYTFNPFIVSNYFL